MAAEGESPKPKTRTAQPKRYADAGAFLRRHLEAAYPDAVNDNALLEKIVKYWPVDALPTNGQISVWLSGVSMPRDETFARLMEAIERSAHAQTSPGGLDAIRQTLIYLYRSADSIAGGRRPPITPAAAVPLLEEAGIRVIDAQSEAKRYYHTDFNYKGIFESNDDVLRFIEKIFNEKSKNVELNNGQQKQIPQFLEISVLVKVADGGYNDGE